MEDRKAAFREFMRRYPTGVTVVTMRAGEVDHGMTANAVTPLSLDPLLYLVCVDQGARAHDLMAAAGHFVVNMLAADQQDVSRAFALKDLSDEERWAQVTTEPSSLGAFRIAGCLGYLECQLTDSFAGGDHTIYVGEVVRADSGEDKAPLIFYGGSYRELAAARDVKAP